jgi:hypothetical protein
LQIDNIQSGYECLLHSRHPGIRKSEERMRPRIGLDMRMVDTIETGLGRYARELARRLPALRPEWDFVLIKRPPLAGVNLGHGLNVKETVVPGYLDHPRNLLAGPQINRLGLDLYHSLHHFLPLGLRIPRVLVTLHDLIWVEHARLTFDTRHAWLMWRVTNLYGLATMRHALAGAHHVIIPRNALGPVISCPRSASPSSITARTTCRRVWEELTAAKPSRPIFSLWETANPTRTCEGCCMRSPWWLPATPTSG